MNLQEFAALKPGDEIENAMTDARGEVVATDARGVHVRWGSGAEPRHYSVQSTIWFHWSKIDVPQQSASGTTDAPTA